MTKIVSDVTPSILANYRRQRTEDRLTIQNSLYGRLPSVFGHLSSVKTV